MCHGQNLSMSITRDNGDACTHYIYQDSRFEWIAITMHPMAHMFWLSVDTISFFWVSFPYQVSVYPNPFLMTKRRNPWGRPSKIHVEFPNFSSRTTRLAAWLFILSSSYCFIRLTIILPTTTRSQMQMDLNLVGGLKPWNFMTFHSVGNNHPNWL